MRLIARFKTLANEETSAERRQRMLPGAIYGLIIASSYAGVGMLVNQLSFPDLPVDVDWQYLLTTWLFFAIWLGVGGAFINWFTQTDESMIVSLLLMSVVALGAGALTLEGSLPTQFGKIILLTLPVLAISLVMTITLRWLGVRHAEALGKGPALRWQNIATLVAIAIAIGGLTGFALTRWGDSTLSGVTEIHRRLQTAVADPARAEELFPIPTVPGLSSHLAVPYTLYGKPSGQSVVAVNVTVNFKDSYQMTCVLLVFPDQPPFLRACAEGNKVILPSQ